MTALDLAGVMADLAAAVQTVLDAGRTAHGHPVESVQPGDAIVGYPEGEQPITASFGRGMDRATVPVWIICGLPQDVGTRAAVSTWVGAGSSVVAAIEGHAPAYDSTATYDSGSYDAPAWSDVAVRTYVIDRFDPVGGNPLVVVRFNVDVLT